MFARKIFWLAAAAALCASLPVFSIHAAETAATAESEQQEAKEYETIEADIETLEQKIQQCDNDMAANSTDFVKLNDIGKIKAQLEEQLTEKMERWEYLMEKAEQIAAQK